MSNGYESSTSTTQPADDGAARHLPAAEVSAALGARWGPRVARVRVGAALSQAALAERCGVTQQTISKIERGRMVPLDPLKLRLAGELGVAPGELFRWP